MFTRDTFYFVIAYKRHCILSVFIYKWAIWTLRDKTPGSYPADVTAGIMYIKVYGGMVCCIHVFRGLHQDHTDIG